MKKSVITAIALAAALPLQAQVSDAAAPNLPPTDSAERLQRYFPAGAAIPTRSSRQPEETPKFSISFPGGTPAELIATLQKAHQQVSKSPMPNVVVAPPMREVMLPPIELQNVGLEDVFQVLNTVSGESTGGYWQLSGNRDPIWVLNATPKRRDILHLAPGEVAPKKTARVLNIGAFLGEFSIDDITTAIQTAWGMLGDPNEAQLKFHKDTNLLIAVGQKEQLDVVTQVLSALQQELRAKKEAEQRAANAGLSGTNELPKSSAK